MLGIWATRKWHDRVANRQYTVVIARNLVFDWFRSNRRIMALDDLEEQVVKVGPSPLPNDPRPCVYRQAV